MEDIRIGLELRALSNMIKRYFEFSYCRDEIDKITGNNGWIIGFLSRSAKEGKDVYQKDIEDHFNITRSTVSNVLSLMEQKGLIQRLPDSQDARLKKIVLTEKAEGVCGILKEDADRMERMLTDGFTAEELEVMHSYIKRMKENISSN
ncbi:MAG: MarR family transcriptional regulator [Oscillospiraceae bacterium]